MEFIKEGNVILVAVLYALGMLLKNSAIKDKLIPIILLFISIVLSMFMTGFNVDAIMQAILCTATAVFTNQLIKQAKEVY